MVGASQWLDTAWRDDKGRQRVRADLTTASTWARAHGHALFIGEFGAYERADMRSRRQWTRCVRLAAEALGVGWLESVPGYRVYDETLKVSNTVRIVQLRRVADCPHAEPVRELVRRTAAASGVTVELEELVGDYPSPTVLVDGQDVTGVPPAEGGFCRLDLPTELQIRAALLREEPPGTGG